MVTKAFLKADWIKLIEQSLHFPIHIQYSSDGTPSLLKQKYALQSSGPLVVRGVASSSQDLFEQRACLTRSDGQHRAMLSEPRGVANCKSAWHLFRCCRDFVGTLRELVHRGFSVASHCWGRAILASMLNRIRAHHDFIHDSFRARGDEAASLLALTDWVAGMGCVSRDGHGALRWAMTKHIHQHPCNKCHSNHQCSSRWLRLLVVLLLVLLLAMS